MAARNRNKAQDDEEKQSALHRLGLPPTYPQVIPFIQFQSPGRGLGLRAAIYIPRGTPILSEAALFSTAGAVVRLPSKARDPQFQELSCPSDPPTDVARFIANNFEMGRDRRRQMKRGIFVTASRFNHSCVPNAHFAWNSDSERLTVHAIIDIQQHEEILINYNSGEYLKPASERQRGLQEDYGFVCDCPACQTDTNSGRASEARRKLMAGLNTIIEMNQDPDTQGQREHLLENIQFFRRQLEEERLFCPQLADMYEKEISWYRREIKYFINGAERTKALYKEEALKIAMAKLDLDVVCSGHDSPEVKGALKIIRELKQE